MNNFPRTTIQPWSDRSGGSKKGGSWTDQIQGTGEKRWDKELAMVTIRGCHPAYRQWGSQLMVGWGQWCQATASTSSGSRWQVRDGEGEDKWYQPQVGNKKIQSQGESSTNMMMMTRLLWWLQLCYNQICSPYLRGRRNLAGRTRWTGGREALIVMSRFSLRVSSRLDDCIAIVFNSDLTAGWILTKTLGSITIVYILFRCWFVGNMNF